MTWHKPQFTLANLVLLIAVLAVEFALLPGLCSVGAVILTLTSALLAAVAGPLTQLDWAAIFAIHVILIGLLVPAAQGSSGRPRKPGPARTSDPASGKI
jgi:hypothetical protein